jgi:hypothetical protein
MKQLQVQNRKTGRGYAELFFAPGFELEHTFRRFTLRRSSRVARLRGIDSEEMVGQRPFVPPGGVR